jgi:hypothetical protein
VPTVTLTAELVVDTKRSHAHDVVAKCDHATTNPRAVFEDEHEFVISVESGAGSVEAPVRRSPRLVELAPDCEIEVLQLRLVAALSHYEACHRAQIAPDEGVRANEIWAVDVRPRRRLFIGAVVM